MTLLSIRRIALALSLGLAAPAALPVAAFAQDAGQGVIHPRGHRGHRLMRMSRALGLSAEQQTQIRSILQEARAQGRALRESTPEGDRRQVMRQHRHEVRERIAAILTPEQRERARELRMRHRGQRA